MGSRPVFANAIGLTAVFLAVFIGLPLSLLSEKNQRDLPLGPVVHDTTPDEINFKDDPGTSFLVHSELELWARNHNLLLVPDAPLRNIQDGIAQTIPQGGLDFTLRKQKAGRVWLYLDLVSFQALPSSQMHKVSWLDVYANEKRLARIYQGGTAFIKTPYRIAIDREHAPDGSLSIHLRPAPGDSIWAIWDAFLSRYQQ